MSLPHGAGARNHDRNQQLARKCIKSLLRFANWHLSLSLSLLASFEVLANSDRLVSMFVCSCFSHFSQLGTIFRDFSATSSMFKIRTCHLQFPPNSIIKTQVFSIKLTIIIQSVSTLNQQDASMSK